MNKSELLSTLEASRKKLLAAFDGLADDQLTESGVVGDWSVKDILSHLTAWEAELVKLLAQARQGRRPAFLDLGETDTLNAKWRQEMKGRLLDQVWADFHGVRRQTLRQLEALNDKDLADPKRYPWLGGKPLGQWIAEQTFEHEQEHLEHIRRWRKGYTDKRG